MSVDRIEIGDVIAIQGFGYRHVGIYVGGQPFDNRDVVHNSKWGGVVLSTLAKFSLGRPVLLHSKATGGYFQRSIIADKARALIGRKFDLFGFNCEHAATLAQTGKAESPQLLAFGFVGLLLLLGTLLGGQRG